MRESLDDRPRSAVSWIYSHFCIAFVLLSILSNERQTQTLVINRQC